jgi:hypothetical protein
MTTVVPPQTPQEARAYLAQIAPASNSKLE